MVNKEVLFSELCSRLPYGVKCDIGDDKPYTLNSIEVDYVGGHLVRFKEMKNGLIMEVYLSEVKPYLFPMSSMTEEQKKEFANLLVYSSSVEMIQITGESTYDWLNKNMFDWRGLIPKGLAKNATGLNIY
jgi:hypothetical protein